MSKVGESLPWGRLSQSRSGRGWLLAVDRSLVWLGDRLNPILVKESRQSSNSRQFATTFGFLIGAGWLWMLFGLGIMGGNPTYETGGPFLFSGYLYILAFPLIVIVPFGAFRSLATEQEDRTYELLAISSLRTSQIISGKLGSALAQMLIYVSAIAPFLAFTYLLRGIAFPTILLSIGLVVLVSFGLCVVGLLAGTLATERHWRAVLSVMFIMALLWAFGCVCPMIAFGGMMFEIAVDTQEFWIGLAAFLTVYITYVALFFYAAVARITFASANRSTKLRVIMAIQHACLIGWFGGVFLCWGVVDDEMPYFFITLLGIHWYAMGALMIGESPELSSRVKRQLPKSLLGRTFFTWFNPGPGTGYLFAISGMFAACVMVAMAAALGGMGVGGLNIDNWNVGDTEQLFTFCALLLAYMTTYLGIGLLMLRLLRRVGQVGLFLAAAIQALLLLAGCAIPVMLLSFSPAYNYSTGYDVLQVTNPFWTLGEVAFGTLPAGLIRALLMLVPSVAIAVFLVNLRSTIGEIRHVRIMKPKRVAEEDTTQAARVTPARPTRTSPWDD